MTAAPPIADRETWQVQLDELRVREKAHTREGDAIAAARRRLPMVEVDPTTPLVGPSGRCPPDRHLRGAHAAYGRQESWEDSPEGWPRLYLGTSSEQMRTDEHGGSVGRPGGRPIPQWPRLAAGRSDDLGSSEE